jgi:translocation and assembly module TamA
VSVAAELARESTDAFEEQRVLLEAGLSRPYGERWKIGGGGELSYLETQENAVTATNILVAFPFFATYDGSNDFFNPTEGYKLDFRFEPVAVTLENTDFFTTFMAGGSVYQQLGEDDDLILAARAKAGFIAGPARDQIPAGRRLFAGGGGSIRGFQFQSVGPLDSINDPEGGRSLAEFGVELRWRLTEDIGIVPFLDGGAAFEDPVPDFTGLRFAAGLGLRYFTPVGPLRLDVATPLNPRQSDGLIEFYISLGQAF